MAGVTWCWKARLVGCLFVCFFFIMWAGFKDFVDFFFFYNIASVSCFGFLVMRYVES